MAKGTDKIQAVNRELQNQLASPDAPTPAAQEPLVDPTDPPKPEAAHEHHHHIEAGDLPESASRFRHMGFVFLHSHFFERSMGLIILLNFIVVIVETDVNAKGEDMPTWGVFVGHGLLTTFVVELIFKMYVLRRLFWHDRWNSFDFVVIAVDLTMSILEVLGMSFLNVSMLRVLRLSRLGRATKVLRVFPELRLMMAGLAGAVSAIFWGTVLLMVALTVFSVLAVQFIHPLNLKVAETGIYDDCDRCARAYESTFQAVLTFTTQIVCGDSWGRETVPIIEAYPISALYFGGVFVSVGLAILNLILGVVVNVATEARDGLLKEMADDKLLMTDTAMESLLCMCQEMDDDGNDELTFDEVKAGFDSNEEFRDTLQHMDIGREDLQIVWTILDSDRSGTVTSKEFVSQVYKMKNSDTQFMLAYIKFYVTEIKDKLRGDLLDIASRMDKDMKYIEKEMEHVDQEVVDIGRGVESVQKQVDKNQMLVEQNAQYIQQGTTKIENEVKGSEEKKQVQKMEIDKSIANFETNARKMEAVMQDLERQNAVLTERLEQATRNNAVVGTVQSGKNDSLQSAIGVVAPLTNGDSLDMLLQSGSLEALFEKVNVLDFEGALPVSALSKMTDPDAVLAQLEGVWKRCIMSVEDMRNFHTNLANLLETMVRRVSVSISQTVAASMNISVDRGRYFTSAARLSDNPRERRKGVDQRIPTRGSLDQPQASNGPQAQGSIAPI